MLSGPLRATAEVVHSAVVGVDAAEVQGAHAGAVGRGAAEAGALSGNSLLLDWDLVIPSSLQRPWCPGASSRSWVVPP